MTHESKQSALDQLAHLSAADLTALGWKRVVRVLPESDTAVVEVEGEGGVELETLSAHEINAKLHALRDSRVAALRTQWDARLAGLMETDAGERLRAAFDPSTPRSRERPNGETS